MTNIRGASLFIALLLLVQASAAPTAIATSQTVPQSMNSEPSSMIAGDGQVLQTTPVNTSNNSNTSSRHVGPDLPGHDAKPKIVLSQLETRIATRLVASSNAVEIRQFDAAEVELRGDTTELLRQYQQVAAASDATTDDAVAEELNLTVQQQRELIERARNARANYSRYQLAQANDNETRAREIARTLLNNSAIGNQTAADLLERYKRLNNETDINTSVIAADLDVAQERLTQLQATVREETFVTTNLTVNTSATASPTHPLRVSGRLTANKSGVANGTIEVSVGDQLVQTTTTSNGFFNATLQPVTIAPGNQTVTVQFVPTPTSQYASATSQVRIQTTSVTPTVDIRQLPDSVQFNDTVTVRGQVTANQTPLPSVSVRAILNRQQIASGRTTQTGEFQIDGRLPEAVPSGAREITLVVSQRNTTVRYTTQTVDLYVRTTNTNLTLTATQLNRTAVHVEGTLQTADGTVLPDRQLNLSVGGAEPRFVRTGPAGRFNATMAVPSTLEPSAIPFAAKQLAVTGQYASPGSNLQSATRSATIQYTPPLSQSLRRVGYLALILTGLLGGVIMWRRRDTDPGPARPNSTVTEVTGASAPIEQPADISPTALLASANRSLSAECPEAAVQFVYAALRHQYVDQYDLPAAMTHWELYRALETQIDESARELLFDLTVAYERATYTETAVSLSEEELRTTLDTVARVLYSDE